ncbi:hypothetical protein MHH62_14140 [Pseudomonas sp. FSL L8-0168]|uniref:hypothetical protein n=1 Tax=Pseudomonas sp. FSL L8-0168 TaxID=2921518 RepID=UPI0030D866C7
MSAQQQVITIDHISEETAPAVYVQNGLKPFLQMIKDEVSGEVPDLSTLKGRERIASLAFTVSKRKAAVEKPGRDYLRKIKELPKVIEQELKQFVDGANALRDEIRQPLTDWENAEQARKDRHVDNIQAIKDLEVFGATPTAAALAQTIAQLEAIELGDSWEEFLPEAAQAKDRTLSLLRAMHAERIQHEAEQAELTQLRLEREARDKKDNEDRIAREAAEEATRLAEKKASDEKAAAEKRENDLKLQAAEAERKAEQAKREKVEADQKAERDRLQAIEDQKKAVEQARLDEIVRANAAADEILRQQQERQADVAHKSKILGEAKQALIGMNISEELAKAIILKIARGEVPNVSIQF